jgi:anti-anti-sigma factor
MNPLVIGVECNDGTVVVSVAGEIDLATAPQLSECLREVCGRVTVDLTKVTFLDSSGMAVFAGAYGRAKNNGGSFALRNPGDAVRRALETTGLGELIASD